VMNVSRRRNQRRQDEQKHCAKAKGVAASI